MDVKTIAAVALGSAIGGALRFIAGQAFVQRFGPGFPFGTLFVNVTGCFIIGLIAELASTRVFGMTPLARIFLATGLVGGYTTFSAFSLDAVVLFEDGAALLSLLYVVSTVVLGIVAAAGGQLVARVAVR
jgi:CrcB protein